ncbi:MAG: GntR family transcriptional regulator, partial [Deinococcales bacterium]
MTFAPVIDKELPTPAYLQLRQALERAIEDGALHPGQALPSERELAWRLHRARMTVRRAFEELEGRGLVEQRQGSGTYVRAHPLEQVLDRVLGFTDEARGLGFRPSATLLDATRQ